MKYIELENGESVTPGFFKVLQKKVSRQTVKQFNAVLRDYGFELLTRKEVEEQDWDPEPHPNVKIWMARGSDLPNGEEVVEVHSDGSWLASFSAITGKKVASLARQLKRAKANANRGYGFHSERD